MKRSILLFFVFIIIKTTSAQSVLFEYVKQLSGNNTAGIGFISGDNFGNIYVAGSFMGTLDFDPGPGVFALTSAGQTDVFFAKYSPAGTLIWAKRIGASAAEGFSDIAVDNDGNMYMTGGYHYTVDFDPGTGYQALTSAALNDVFIAKYDTSGSLVWVTGMGGPAEDIGRSVVVDASGNVYLTGSFAGSFWVGSDYLDAPGSNTVYDIFICKLNSNGVFEWAQRIGDSANDIGYKILLDVAGNLIVSGQFTATVDFDPGMNSAILSSASGTRDIFIAKYDTSGNFVSAGQISGSEGDEFIYNMELMNDGKIAITGSFLGSVDLDPDTSEYIVTDEGDFLLVLNSDLSFNRTTLIKNASIPVLGIDNLNNIILSGKYLKGVSFTSNGVSATFPGPDTTGFYIAKMDSAANIVFVKTIVSSDINAGAVFTEATGDMYVGGNFYGGPVSFDEGNPDATFTASILDPYFMKFTPCAPSYAVAYADGCDSVFFAGHWYSETGTYLEFMENASGCDSIVTLQVAISNSTYDTLDISSCGPVVSPSGLYFWDASGYYADTLVSSSGCDSVLMCHLTIKSVDTSLTYNFPDITAQAGNATFQWLHCDGGNYSLIAGETSQTYTATQDGSYAVQITQNGCTDTSACIQVTGNGFSEFNKPVLQIAPNPSNGVFSVLFDKEYKDILLAIYDASGRLVLEKEYHGSNEITCNMNGSQKYYFLRIVIPEIDTYIFPIMLE